ncbi:hypothetical protein, partial [Prevotella sp.]|uniref:hypothetical protein n=1 Tax=Prevotella sp. TaxID=59823 RepID=UPI003076C337
QYGLVIYGLSSIHDAKIKNNIGLLKTQQYYLIHSYHSPPCGGGARGGGLYTKKKDDTNHSHRPLKE